MGDVKPYKIIRHSGMLLAGIQPVIFSGPRLKACRGDGLRKIDANQENLLSLKFRIDATNFQ